MPSILGGISATLACLPMHTPCEPRISPPMHRTPPLLQGPIFTEWFKGGKTNIAYNCLDRHVKEGYGDQVCVEEILLTRHTQWP